MRGAICAYRRHSGIDGPLLIGMDTHASSEAVLDSAIEVLAANGVETMIDHAYHAHAHATADLGNSHYARTDAPASAAQRAALAKPGPNRVGLTTLAGEPVLSKPDHALGNSAPIGGIKVAANDGWFAVRPSGTEDIYKIYAESFRDDGHLKQIQDEAQGLVDHLFGQT